MVGSEHFKFKISHEVKVQMGLGLERGAQLLAQERRKDLYRADSPESGTESPQQGPFSLSPLTHLSPGAGKDLDGLSLLGRSGSVIGKAQTKLASFRKQPTATGNDPTEVVVDIGAPGDGGGKGGSAAPRAGATDAMFLPTTSPHHQQFARQWNVLVQA